jgi:hypothetical protein
VTFGDETAVDTTASFATDGTYVLELTADDGELTASDTVTITVEPEPDGTPPVVGILSPLNGSTVSGEVTIMASASDNEGVTIVEFAVDGAPLGSDLTGPSYEVDWDTTLVANGSYTLTAMARDAANNEASDSVTVQVDNPTNLAPTVDAGANDTIVLPDVANLAGIVTDDGLPGGVVTTTWSVDSGPDTVTFGDETAVDTTASFATDGVYVLALTADDGELTASDTVTITVEAEPDGTPPTVGILSPLNGATISGDVTITASVSDNVGVTIVEFEVNGAPLGTDLTGPSYEVNWDTTLVANGSYTLTATARDAADNEASDSVTVEVDNISNLAPVVDAGTDQTIELPNLAQLKGTVDDDGLPGGPLITTWSVVSGPGAVALFGNMHALNTTVSFSIPGTYVLRLTANDGEWTSSDTVKITVNPNPNQTPSFRVLLPVVLVH